MPKMRPETEAAIRAAGVAQQIANARKGADQLTSKGGIDLVTATDIACEDAIRSELTSAFPDYPVIGEERGGVPQPGTPYWLVDPICGTRPFASQVPLYCSNIALVEDRTVTVAAIGVGVTAELLYAEKAAGAWVRTSFGDKAISVGDHSNTLWVDTNTDHGTDVIQRALKLKRWYIWLFGSTVAYAYLAMGRISGVLHLMGPSTRAHGSMHTAAGCFIAGEAGAFVKDLDSAKDWDLTSRSLVLASTSELLEQLTDLARKT